MPNTRTTSAGDIHRSGRAGVRASGGGRETDPVSPRPAAFGRLPRWPVRRYSRPVAGVGPGSGTGRAGDRAPRAPDIAAGSRGQRLDAASGAARHASGARLDVIFGRGYLTGLYWNIELNYSRRCSTRASNR